jgi:hypothetical protein
MKENSGTEETKKLIHKSVEFMWDKKTKQNNTLKQNMSPPLTIQSSLNTLFPVGS